MPSSRSESRDDGLRMPVVSMATFATFSTGKPRTVSSVFAFMVFVGKDRVIGTGLANCAARFPTKACRRQEPTSLVLFWLCAGLEPQQRTDQRRSLSWNSSFSAPGSRVRRDWTGALESNLSGVPRRTAGPVSVITTTLLA